MSTQLKGLVRMAGETGRGVDVRIHLEEETLTLAAAGGAELGTWSLDEVGIASKPDGFHLRIEGEEVILNTDDDARFALAIGISTPTNRLARQMAHLRDQAAGLNLTVDLTSDETEPLAPPPLPEPSLPPRRSSRAAEGVPYLGPMIVLAGTVAFLASIVALASGSAITFPGEIAAWPAMMVASLILAAGGFTAFQQPERGLIAIAAGTAIALVSILLTAGRVIPEGLAEEALFAFTIATVFSGGLLAIDTARRHTLD